MVLFRAREFVQARFWPDSLEPRIYLGNEFLIVPLLAGLDVPREFWVLALSINCVRLFRATHEALRSSIAQPRAAKPCGSHELHPTRPRSREPLCGGTVHWSNGRVHFGTSSVQTKLRLLHDYFKIINRALRPILEPCGDPLILAAVWRELAVYRELNTYSGPVEQAIQGSPDGLRENQLCAKAMKLMAANGGFPTGQYQRKLDIATNRGLLLSDPAAIAKAAQRGQIQRLFLAADYGTDEDLLNSLAITVIRNSGRVAFAKKKLMCRTELLPFSAIALTRHCSGNSRSAGCKAERVLCR
jgi:hypothetical protein